jgi:hypothetical protein
MGECLLSAVSLKITEACQIFGYFVPQLRYAINLTKKGWATFWANFSKTHLVTLSECLLRGDGVNQFLSSDWNFFPSCEKTLARSWPSQ